MNNQYSKQTNTKKDNNNNSISFKEQVKIINIILNQPQKDKNVFVNNKNVKKGFKYTLDLFEKYYPLLAKNNKVMDLKDVPIVNSINNFKENNNSNNLYTYKYLDYVFNSNTLLTNTIDYKFAFYNSLYSSPCCVYTYIIYFHKCVCNKALNS